jgi:hypothetical protein
MVNGGLNFPTPQTNAKLKTPRDDDDDGLNDGRPLWRRRPCGKPTMSKVEKRTDQAGRRKKMGNEDEGEEEKKKTKQVKVQTAEARQKQDRGTHKASRGSRSQKVCRLNVER